jgi:hypothetical protein
METLHLKITEENKTIVHSRKGHSQLCRKSAKLISKITSTCYEYIEEAQAPISGVGHKDPHPLPYD